MKWSEFKRAVAELITVDSERIGSEAYIERMTRLGLGEVQRLILRYRQGHKLNYLVADVVEDGDTSTIVLESANLTITEIYRVGETDSCVRRPFSTYPFTNRNDLVCGRVDKAQDLVAINREATKLWIYPKLEASYKIELIAEGVRLQFNDEDTVPFDERVAVVVAEYVKSKLAREVERDIKLAESYLASYRSGLNTLYSSDRDAVDLSSAKSDARAKCGPGSCDTSESSPTHTHTIEQVTGLQDALDGLGTEIDDLTDVVATKQAALPAGTIIMWYGAANAVPSGWLICDGSNGTPDLRSKAPMGANPATGTPSGNTIKIFDNTGSYEPQLITFLNVHFIIKA